MRLRGHKIDDDFVPDFLSNKVPVILSKFIRFIFFTELKLNL